MVVIHLINNFWNFWKKLFYHFWEGQLTVDFQTRNFCNLIRVFLQAGTKKVLPFLTFLLFTHNDEMIAHTLCWKLMLSTSDFVTTNRKKKKAKATEWRLFCFSVFFFVQTPNPTMMLLQKKQTISWLSEQYLLWM